MDEVLRCSKCGSSQTRFRIKTNDRFCYSCGNIYLIEEKKELVDGSR